jgi:hypothetical protein
MYFLREPNTRWSENFSVVLHANSSTKLQNKRNLNNDGNDCFNQPKRHDNYEE